VTGPHDASEHSPLPDEGSDDDAYFAFFPSRK
jgi:hypothetical protein